MFSFVVELQIRFNSLLRIQRLIQEYYQNSSNAAVHVIWARALIPDEPISLKVDESPRIILTYATKLPPFLNARLRRIVGAQATAH